MRREREEQRRLLQEEIDFERIMSFNLGPMNSLDAEQEVRGPDDASFSWPSESGPAAIIALGNEPSGN